MILAGESVYATRDFEKTGAIVVEQKSWTQSNGEASLEDFRALFARYVRHAIHDQPISLLAEDRDEPFKLADGKGILWMSNNLRITSPL